MKAQRITETVAYHAEGPLWWPALNAVRWVDMLAGDVLTLHPDGEIDRIATGSQVVSVIRPRRGGGAVLARERDVVVCRSEDLRDLSLLVKLFSDNDFRTNEGGCDPDGRFYVGTMSKQKVPGSAQVYRIGPGGDSRTVLTGVTTSNGLGFSPDGRLAYYNDTPTREVSVFDYQDGELRDRRRFVRIPDDKGKPDGLCVDAEGGVWVALHRGSAVHRYAPDGELSQVIELPVSQVTACTFGGPQLDTLYITTSRERLPDDAEPQAGSLFAVQPGVKGLPPLEFAG